MALTLLYSRITCLCPARLLILPKLPFFPCSLLHESMDGDTGVLDDFTSQLVQRKSTKWERKKSLAQKKLQCNVMPLSNAQDNISNLELEAIDELFQKALDYDDSTSVKDLIKQCMKYNKIPPLNTFLRAISLCSKLGDMDTITELSQLCEKTRPEILQENSNFEHYIAEAIWIKGDVNRSLDIFHKVYKENPYLRRRIRSILKSLVFDSVSICSEATVINIIRFSSVLVEEYNDYFLLGCLWQACVLSEWFSDQQIAMELLNKHPKLCSVIINKIPFVVMILLRYHRTEVVYRLTEALLKFNMESEVAQVILALLNYWLQQGDMRQCKEIVLWLVENNIDVPAITGNDKLMGLFTKDLKVKVKIDAPKQTPSDYKF